jgi:hypothetical protein
MTQPVPLLFNLCITFSFIGACCPFHPRSFPALHLFDVLPAVLLCERALSIMLRSRACFLLFVFRPSLLFVSDWPE